MRYLLFLMIYFTLSQPALAALVTEAIEYRHGNQVLEGHLAYDDATQEKRPGILVVHEWKGLNGYAKGRAEQLAVLGYVAFAMDMYGKGIYAKDHQEAGQLAGIYKGDRNLMRSRAKAGYNILKKHELVDAQRLAAIGYCFGGTTVLEMARAGFDLKGVVSFHGGLSSPVPAKPGAIKSTVLVMHGAEDRLVNAGVPAFKDEMRQAKADWQFFEFGGAVHGFTVPHAGDDPSKGVAYNERADKRSWEIMKQFFNENFK